MLSGSPWNRLCSISRQALAHGLAMQPAASTVWLIVRPMIVAYRIFRRAQN